MTRLLRIFPAFCLVGACISVLADMRGALAWLAFGTADEGFDVTRPFGFQAFWLLVRAIIQSLEWVAYGALGELALRIIDRLDGLRPERQPAGDAQ